MMLIICALCGREEPHEARGLGHGCYNKARALGMLSAFARGRRAPSAQDRRCYWQARYQQQKAARAAGGN
jgi:hypothetical protein